MGNFTKSQLSRFAEINPEMSQLYDLYNDARMVSLYLANVIPSPLQTRRYAGRQINEPDDALRQRKIRAWLSRETTFDVQEVSRVLVMGQAALRGEHVDQVQLDVIEAAIKGRTYLIGIIPDDRMPMTSDLPGNWHESVEQRDRSDLIVISFADGTSWTALRGGAQVTPYTEAGTALNASLLEVSMHLSHLAMFGNQAAELVAGMHQ